MATEAEQVLGSRPEASGRRFGERLSVWGIVTQLAPFALAFAVYLAVFLVMRPETTGDEPHYLIIAESLAFDGDVSLANDYASRERVLRVVTQFPLPKLFQARVYTESGEVRPTHGVGLPAVLAPAVAVGGLTGARIVMLVIAALLADQLYRLLRDLRFRRRYRTLAWASVVFCLPVLAFANQIYPELPGALLVLVSLRIMIRGRPSPAALVFGSTLAAALVWLHVRYVSLSLAVLLGLAIAAFSDVRLKSGPSTQRGLHVIRGALRRLAVAAAMRWRTVLVPLVVPYVVGIGLLGVAFHDWYGAADPRAPYLGWGYSTVGSGGLDFMWRFLLTDLFNPIAGWIPYAPVQWLGLAALGCLIVWFRWPAAACIAVAAGNEVIIANAAPGVGWGFPARFLLIVIPLIAVPIALVLQELPVTRVIWVPLMAFSLVVSTAFAHDYLRAYPVGDKPRVFGVRNVASIFPIVNSPLLTTTFTLDPGLYPPLTGRVQRGQVVAKESRDAPGFLMWGPYSSLREGEYRATFQLAASGVEGNVPVATIETTGIPPPKAFTHKVVTAAELGRGSKDVRLDFKTPGGFFVETRVYYQGHGTVKAGPVVVTPLHVKARTWAPEWLLAAAWVSGTILAGWLFIRLLRRRSQNERA